MKNFFTKIYLVVVLIFLFNITTYAQSIEGSYDSSTNPKIFLKDEYVETEYFPAISEDNASIALIHTTYTCCASDIPTEFRIIKTTGSSSPTLKITISEGDKDPSIPHKKKLQTIKKVNDFLKKQPYRSMVQVSPPVSSYTFPIEKASSPNTYYLKFTYDEVEYRSDKFKLNKMKQKRGYCCTGEVNGPACMIEPSVIELWMDLKSKFLLIGAGNNFGSDGCELGPKYVIVKFKQQK